MMIIYDKLCAESAESSVEGYETCETLVRTSARENPRIVVGDLRSVEFGSVAIEIRKGQERATEKQFFDYK